VLPLPQRFDEQFQAYFIGSSLVTLARASESRNSGKYFLRGCHDSTPVDESSGNVVLVVDEDVVVVKVGVGKRKRATLDL
jgi:hypothetical protein